MMKFSKLIIIILIPNFLFSCESKENQKPSNVEKLREIQKDFFTSQSHLIWGQKDDTQPKLMDYYSSIRNLDNILDDMDKNLSKKAKYIENKRASQLVYIESLKTNFISPKREIIIPEYENLSHLTESNYWKFIEKELVNDIHVNNKICNELALSRFVITDYNFIVNQEDLSNDSTLIKIDLIGISNRTSPSISLNGDLLKVDKFWHSEVSMAKEELGNPIEIDISYQKYYGKPINKVIKIERE